MKFTCEAIGCSKPTVHTTRDGVSLCVTHYGRKSRYGGDWNAPIKTSYHPKTQEMVQKNFLDKTVVSAGGCLLWTGQMIPIDEYGRGGYGLAHVPSDIPHRVRKTTAHRVSWLIFRGPLTSDDILLHSCDNRLCVNVEHLRIGTYSDNTQDMLSKGRHPRMGKIRDKYRESVLLLRDEGLTQDSIAEKLGISQTTVSNIIRERLRNG